MTQTSACDLLARYRDLLHQLVTDLEIEWRTADDAYIRAIEAGASHASADREGQIAARAAMAQRKRTEAELDYIRAELALRFDHQQLFGYDQLQRQHSVLP